MTRADEIAATLPLELQRSVPREVALTAAGRVLAGLAVLLVVGSLLAGVVLYLVAAEDAAGAERRRREGVSATAEIVSIRRTRGDNPRAVLSYRFFVDGREFGGAGRMPGRAARGLLEGSKVQVGYLASHPAENWLAGREPRGVSMAVVPLPLLGGLFFAALIVWSLRRQSHFLEEGRPTLARVVSTRRASAGKSSAQRVEVEFHDLSGALQRSHFSVSSKPPDTGATIIVLYDREDPRRLARYPLSLVRVVTPL